MDQYIGIFNHLIGTLNQYIRKIYFLTCTVDRRFRSSDQRLTPVHFNLENIQELENQGGIKSHSTVPIRCTYTLYLYGVPIRCTYTLYLYGVSKRCTFAGSARFPSVDLVRMSLHLTIRCMQYRLNMGGMIEWKMTRRRCS